MNDLNVHLTGLGEALTYRPASVNSGALNMAMLQTRYAFANLAGAVTILGGGGREDQVRVEGSHTADLIEVSAAGRTVYITDRSGQRRKPLRLDDSIDLVSVDGRLGDDTFLISPDFGQNPPLQVFVQGGSASSGDRLLVEDEGAGDIVRQHGSINPRSGSVLIGSLPAVEYGDIARVDVFPLGADGNTGQDQAGRLVTLPVDPFSPNDTLNTATDLSLLENSTVHPSISPGGVADPFGLGFDVPGDVDWYRFRAPRTGTFQFTVLHEAIAILPNGHSGLPAAGQLSIDVFTEDGSPITRLASESDVARQTVGVEGGKSYYLRIQGDDVEAVNSYDVGVQDVDQQGPIVFDPDLADLAHAVHISGSPEFNLFNGMREQGPTPSVHRLTVHVQDPAIRYPGFLYPALDPAVAAAPGNYRLIGDHHGTMAITAVTISNAPVEAGQVPTATVELHFDGPLPDDRYTLTLFDTLLDPSSNPLDGGSDAAQPNGKPSFPSGDSVPGGDFVARFTVDSRTEIATYLGDGTWYVDLNGNGVFDTQNSDFTNRDLVWKFGTKGDQPVVGDWNGDGFAEIGVFTTQGGRDVFQLDLDGNGAYDPTVDARIEFRGGGNGVPVAGDWDGDGRDEVGTFASNAWYLDADANAYFAGTAVVSTNRIATSMSGLPVVGDWDGDGTDNVGTFDQGRFYLDTDGSFAASEITASFPEFDFGGLKPRPVAGDWDQDGNADLGLFVIRETGQNSGSREAGEWFLDVNTDLSGAGLRTVRFEPPLTGVPGVPFSSQDIFYNFGDEREPASLAGLIPLAGNFDPPVRGFLKTPAFAQQRPTGERRDVSGDGVITAWDALLVINAMNAKLRGGANRAGDNLAMDVNGDSVVSPLDALVIINAINSRPLSAEAEAIDESASRLLPDRMDVSGDGVLSPLDALLVLNAVQAQSQRTGRGLEIDLALDVNFDAELSALDALVILNRLHANTPVAHVADLHDEVFASMAGDAEALRSPVNLTH